MAKTKRTKIFPSLRSNFYPGAIVNEDIKSIVTSVGSDFDKLDGAKLLITGAGGLYGSYFLDTIVYLNKFRLKKPCKVTALQRNSIRKSLRLRHLVGYPYIDFVEHDASKPYVTKTKFDYIIHSAGMSAPAFFTADPLGTIHINVSGLEWIMEKAKKDSTKGVLYMSSGEIYGKLVQHGAPIKETYNGNVNPLDSRGCYSESKRLAETICSIYSRLYKVPVKIARPFATFGPGITLSDRRVMGDFLKSVLAGKSISMLTDGSDIKTFCYVSDAAVAFWKILLSGKPGDVYNVGNPGNTVSVLELAELFHKACNIKSKVKVKRTKGKLFIKDAPTLAIPDISKLTGDLGVKPVVSLENGIKRLLAWNKEIIQKKI